MDEEAVWHADDSVLKKNGILADGDVIRLKVMCKHQNIDLTDRKKDLKDMLEFGAETRLQTKPLSSLQFSSTEVKKNAKSKTVYVSWEHFDTKKSRYALVKADKG